MKQGDLVEVKFTDGGKDNAMPFYWMALLSFKFPGQFYRVSGDSKYIIFSGRGFENLVDISKSINAECRDLKIDEVKRVDKVPENSEPLFPKLFAVSIDNMARAQGRSIESARAIEVVIRNRYQRLLQLFEMGSHATDPFQDEVIFLLEKTAAHYYRMGNTVKSGDLGRASCYISEVLLRDTTSEQSKVIPNFEPNCVFHVFNLSPKPHLKNSTSLKEDAKLLVAKIANKLGCVASVSNLDVVIKHKVIADREKSLFLELVRTAFYESALDGNYELNWSRSCADFKLEQDNEATDDEEEELLSTVASKIAMSEKFDEQVLQNGWKRSGPRTRVALMPGLFAESAIKLCETLNKKGFSAIAGQTDSGASAVQVTLRGKG